MRAASEGNTAAAPSAYPPVEVTVESTISPTPTDSSAAAPDASTKNGRGKGSAEISRSRPSGVVVVVVVVVVDDSNVEITVATALLTPAQLYPDAIQSSTLHKYRPLPHIAKRRRRHYISKTSIGNLSSLLGSTRRNFADINGTAYVEEAVLLPMETLQPGERGDSWDIRGRVKWALEGASRGTISKSDSSQRRRLHQVCRLGSCVYNTALVVEGEQAAIGILQRVFLVSAAFYAVAAWVRYSGAS